MFGKAVKIRHCPATVSATGELFVFFEGTPGNPARCHWEVSLE
jgi:hypothetical protein